MDNEEVAVEPEVTIAKDKKTLGAANGEKTLCCIWEYL